MTIRIIFDGFGQGNQVFEGNPQLYEPFYEAFSLNGYDSNRTSLVTGASKGFLTDPRFKIFRKLFQKQVQLLN